MLLFYLSINYFYTKRRSLGGKPTANTQLENLLWILLMHAHIPNASCVLSLSSSINEQTAHIVGRYMDHLI